MGGFHPSIVRRAGAGRRVTPLELFFDLVYVFAVSQLAGLLAGQLDLRSGFEVALLTLAVAYAWYMITWGFNWLEPDRLSVQLMLVALMAASLLMSTGIAGAFGDRVWQFVAGYLAIQLGRTVFLIVVLAGHRLRGHFVNALVWELAAGGLWIAGALAHADARLGLFGAAVAVTYLGIAVVHALPVRGHRFDLAHSEVASEHFFERFRLFFILALGETVLAISAVFTEEPFTVTRLMALGVAFAGAVGLWWCYFQRTDGLGAGAAEAADDPGPIAFVHTFALTAMLLALIAVAVASELAVAHPEGSPSAAFSSLAFGGPALFLLAQVWTIRAVLGRVSASRLIALPALGLLAAATTSATLLAALAAATAVPLAIAVHDTISREL